MTDPNITTIDENPLQRALCCPERAHGFLREDPNYIPLGEMISYDSISAYKVGRGKEFAIILIHDIFGLHSGMHKLLCDKLSVALPNCTVIAPDFCIHGNLFGDDPLKGRGFAAMIPKLLWAFCSCKLFGFINKISWDNSAGSVFNKTTHHLVSMGIESFATAGVCYGSYVGFRASGSAYHKLNIFANISFHPSVASLAGLYKENEKDIVSSVSCPQMIAATKDEPISWKPKGNVEKVLSSISIGELCEYYCYDTENHGFMTRGDTKNDATAKNISDCFEKTVDFIRKTRHHILLVK